jgi:hypothetical protein
MGARRLSACPADVLAFLNAAVVTICGSHDDRVIDCAIDDLPVLYEHGYRDWSHGGAFCSRGSHFFSMGSDRRVSAQASRME